MAKLDVVEIDPGITLLAKKYFNLKTDPRLTIYHQDGRVFLNQNKNIYDSIYIDAFNSITIPYQLTTREAVQKMYDSLNNKGLVVLNLISSLEDEGAKLFLSEYATYKSIFPLVHVFRVTKKNPEATQNIILIALKGIKETKLLSNNRELNDYLKMVWQKNINNGSLILTDDYSPVDYYSLNTIRF